MNDDSQRRARLVSTLWNLKQAVKQTPLPGIPYIHFNSLLRQVEYRREVLAAARASDNPELVALAHEAEQLDTEDSALLNPDDKRWLEQRDRQLAETYARELESTSRAKRVYARLAAGLVALVAIVIAGYLAYQALAANVRVSGNIDRDTRWSAGREYILEDLVIVAPGTRLSIDPGVTIRGRPGSALVVSRGAFLHAKGTATQPIVMTSSQTEGRRQPGDWGGLVLLGAAPVNVGAAIVEGFPDNDPRGAYGGSDPAHACGVLEYLRIEFAGYEALANNELNGLTLAGCGSDTVVRFVQVHRGLDDGVEVFGGTVNLKGIVISEADDDALDWDEGWVGDVQFLITRQLTTGDNAFEGDSNRDNPAATPVSRPRIFNATLIGAQGGAQRAMTIRSGSQGEFVNMIASGFPVEFLDIQGAESARALSEGRTRFDALVLSQIGPRGSTAVGPTAETEDDDGMFDEAGFILGLPNLDTRGGVRLSVRSRNIEDPDFVPAGEPELAPAAIPSGEFWDQAATYPGAVAPGSSNPWYEGWTAFPES